jgi:hypothetical protein
MKTIGGSLIICDGLKYDYPFIEAIKSLEPVCDKIVVVMFSQEDLDAFNKACDYRPGVTVSFHKREEWDTPDMGRLRLSYWTNHARDLLKTDYQLNLQGDEIIHESCYPAIREAVEKGREAYFLKRINLWGDPFHQLNVPVTRRPVAESIIRLAKKEYDSVDDAEAIKAPASDEYLEKIRIYHMGFVRKREIHTKKIIQMQKNIFHIEVDPRLKQNEAFDPWSFYTKGDVIPIQEPLPKVIQPWADERKYEDI